MCLLRGTDNLLRIIQISIVFRASNITNVRHYENADDMHQLNVGVSGGG